MTLGDTVRETLKREYAAGATYQTIASRHNISTPYARGLILGEDRSGGISLDKLEAMFPHAHLNLTGSGASVSWRKWLLLTSRTTPGPRSSG